MQLNSIGFSRLVGVICKTSGVSRKQILLSIKFTVIILLSACFSASAKSYGQITLDVKNVSLQKAFMEIRKQSGYNFLYSAELVQKAGKVSVKMSNASLELAVEECLKDKYFSYSIVEKTVIIKPRPVMPQATISLQQNAPETDKLTGKITGQNGQPLEGATVSIKGSNTATQTGNGGNFEIEIEPGSTIIVSYVGYETKELQIGKNMDITISMKLSDSKVEEVVVIGYGSTRKKDITGSIASISMIDQEKAPVLGIEQMISGRASGVEVMQNQSQPGAVFSVRIRGTNSINAGSAPLYVIDGYAGGDMSNLNPSDIFSIDILKDASATAIYGSRGANGVVIITTKRGSLSASKVSIDAYTGIQSVSRKYDMMDAKQYGIYLNTVRSEFNTLNGTSLPLPFTQSKIDSLGKGTDWQDAIFKKASISNVSLAFNGGTTDTKHYLSFNYFDQGGIIIGSNYKKGTMRFNLDQKISNKLKIGVSSQLGYSYANNVSVNTEAIVENSVLWDAVRFNPMIPVRNEDGTYPNNGPLGPTNPLGNPVGFVKSSNDGNYKLSAMVNGFGEFEILKGLKLRSSFGINYGNDGREIFIPTGVFSAGGNGRAEKSSGQSYNWLNENTLTYDKIFNDVHSINIIGGVTSQYWHDKYFSGGIINLSTNLVGANNFGIGIADNPSSSFADHFLASYFTRANYRLLDKYLFTFTVRADGSSRFGANDKWGYFPSGAFAWNLSKENFIKNIKTITDLKLRISYGNTGNQEIGSYNSLSQYSLNSYQLGRTPTLVSGIYPANIANPNLKWESTTSSDFGLDLGLWDNRVNITADYYNKQTSNLLLNVTLPQTSGYRSILLNTGTVSNKGFELSVSTVNIDRSKFRWNTSLVFSTNRNKVLSLGSNKQIYVGQTSGSLFNGSSFNSSILIPGKPIGSFYGYVFDGIWQSNDEITKSGITDPVHPGDPKYKDLNNDHTISAEDRTIIGQARPKFTYGITNNLTIGRFNVYLLLQGVYGNKILNENLYQIQNGDPADNKLAYVATDSWHGEGTSNTLPRVSSILRTSLGVTSDIIENGSYLRIKTLTLSYEIPLSNTSIFKTANVYVTAQNLYTFTKYSGYDPEVNSFSDNNDALTLGTDFNAYPNYRTFLVGVKFRF
ncbi:MAG: TonB-dependent receptor [Ginsengibacter sp.]